MKFNIFAIFAIVALTNARTTHKQKPAGMAATHATKIAAPLTLAVVDEPVPMSIEALILAEISPDVDCTCSCGCDCASSCSCTDQAIGGTTQMSADALEVACTCGGGNGC